MLCARGFAECFLYIILFNLPSFIYITPLYTWRQGFRSQHLKAADSGFETRPAYHLKTVLLKRTPIPSHRNLVVHQTGNDQVETRLYKSDFFGGEKKLQKSFGTCVQPRRANDSERWAAWDRRACDGPSTVVTLRPRPWEGWAVLGRVWEPHWGRCTPERCRQPTRRPEGVWMELSVR